MSSDEDMLAQIANIEAQLSFQQQAAAPQQQQAWQPTSTFGSHANAQQAPAAHGFPRAAPQSGQGYPQQGGPQAAGGAPGGHQFSKDTDDRSVFVGNLPKGQNGYFTTPEELAAFFQDCGQILNCTVLKDKATGELKGTAYLEFATYEGCGRAIDTKNNAVFKGNALTVSKKRSLYRPGGVPRGGVAPGGPRGGRGGRGGGNMFQADPVQAMMALMAMSAGMQQFMGGAPRGRGGPRGGRGGGRGGYPGPGSGTGHNEGGGFQPFQ